jgi:hypothetical protein
MVRDVEPGEYVVEEVHEYVNFRYGIFREPDGTTRALALTESEYVRAHELLKRGYGGVKVVRNP